MAATTETKDKPKKYYISVLRTGSDDVSETNERKGKKVAVTWLKLPSIQDDKETGDFAVLDVTINDKENGEVVDVAEVSRPKSNQFYSVCSFKGKNKGKFTVKFTNDNGWHISGMEYEFPAQKKA
jgi:hypothetical protein